MPTEPDDATLAEDEKDAKAAHTADRRPTPTEEELADESTLDESVAEHHHDANVRGAGVKGEGEIVPGS
jgi:hypothetical protein